jgi:hypothetical protein
MATQKNFLCDMSCFENVLLGNATHPEDSNIQPDYEEQQGQSGFADVPGKQKCAADKR